MDVSMLPQRTESYCGSASGETKSLTLHYWAGCLCATKVHPNIAQWQFQVDWESEHGTILEGKGRLLLHKVSEDHTTACGSFAAYEQFHQPAPMLHGRFTRDSILDDAIQFLKAPMDNNLYDHRRAQAQRIILLDSIFFHKRLLDTGIGLLAVRRMLYNFTIVQEMQMDSNTIVLVRLAAGPVPTAQAEWTQLGFTAWCHKPHGVLACMLHEIPLLEASSWRTG